MEDCGVWWLRLEEGVTWWIGFLRFKMNYWFFRYVFLIWSSDCDGFLIVSCLGSSFTLSSCTLTGDDSYYLTIKLSLTLTRSYLAFSLLMNTDIGDSSFLSLKIDSKFSWRYFRRELIACTCHISILLGEGRRAFGFSTLRWRLIFI